MSTRLETVSNSASLQTSERVAGLKSKGIPVVDLTLGEPDFDTPACVKKMAEDAMSRNLTHYTSARGIPTLREEIVDYLMKRRDAEVSADDVIVTPGAKQGLFYVMCSVLDPGDEVVIPEPTWLSYGDIVKLNDGVSVFTSGGMGSYDDAVELFRKTRRDACAIEKMLFLRDYDIVRIKAYLSGKTVPVRDA